MTRTPSLPFPCFRLQGTMNGNPYEQVHGDQLHSYHSAQARQTAAAPGYSHAPPSGGGGSHMGEPGTLALASPGNAPRGFGRMGDDDNDHRQLQQPSEGPPPPGAEDPSFRGHGQHDQQQHHHRTPQSLIDIAGDGRSPMSLGLSMSSPVGGGGVFTPPSVQQGQQKDRFPQQQQTANPRSLASISLSSVGGAAGASYSPEPAPQDDGQEQQHPQSAVGAVIAEVATRRSRRSVESQQPQSWDADMEIDVDVERRGTPMSDGRQTMAQPRLLLSELNADGPGSATGAGEILTLQEARGEGVTPIACMKRACRFRVRNSGGDCASSSDV